MRDDLNHRIDDLACGKAKAVGHRVVEREGIRGELLNDSVGGVWVREGMRGWVWARERKGARVSATVLEVCTS